MNKSPVPAVLLITGVVFKGKLAAVSVTITQIVRRSAAVSPVVVDRVRALDHHIAVATLDVPTLG